MSPHGKRKRSSVWCHFIETNNPTKIKCAHCERICSISGGSTGNLIRHMRMKHPKVIIDRGGNESLHTNSVLNYDAISSDINDNHNEAVQAVLGIDCNISVDEMKPNHDPAASNQQPMAYYLIEPVDENKSKQMDKQLLKMIVKEFHSFNIVEHPEFRKLVSFLNPAYNLPSLKELTKNLLPQVYQATMNELKSTLINVTAVALTMDKWTSVNNERYIAVTIHYLNKDFELKASFLGCTSLPEKYTSKNIAGFLRELTNEWGLSNKVVAIVTDNTASMVGAVKECKWHHVPCFADVLNIIVKAGLEEIEPLIEKIRHIVGYFKRSPVTLDKLHEVQNKMGLPNLKLKNDVPTRWNSTFDMITRFSKNKEALLHIIEKLQLHSLQLSSSDWNVIEKAIKLLIIFNTITAEISSENTFSLSKVPYIVKFMLKHVTKILEESDLPPKIATMATKFKEELQTLFNELESNDIIGQSVLLDPRFKKRGFPENSYKKAYSSLRTQIISLKGEMINEKDAVFQKQSETRRNTMQSEYFIDIWDEFKEREPTPQNNVAEAAVSEIGTFINDAYISLSDSPITYWANTVNQSKFPTVFELVKRRLCVPATSVPGERIFTKAGNALLEKRNYLTSGKLKEILFLNHNL